MNNTQNIASVERFDTGSLKWSRYGTEVIPMWVADTDFQASPSIMQALHDRTDHGVFGYTNPTQQQIDTCVSYFEKKWNWKVDPSWLVFSPGLGVTLHTVTRYIGDKKKATLVPKPIYHVFRNASMPAKRQRIDVSMTNKDGNWYLDLDNLKKQADQNGGASVLMFCNPHNPNGKVFTKKELEDIAELCLKENWTICADEVHADLILDPELTHIPIASLSKEIADICITLQSPSKAYNIAGLNIAVNVISNPKLREQYIAGAKGQVIDHLNPFGLVAAKAAWDGSSEAWLVSTIVQLRSNRDKLQASIDKIDNVHMDHLCSTYLAWIDVSKLGFENPHDHFVKHGIGLSPGKDFGDERFLRLNFGCSDQILEEGIKRFKNACNAL